VTGVRVHDVRREVFARRAGHEVDLHHLGHGRVPGRVVVAPARAALPPFTTTMCAPVSLPVGGTAIGGCLLVGLGVVAGRPRWGQPVAGLRNRAQLYNQTRARRGPAVARHTWAASDLRVDGRGLRCPGGAPCVS
jgi:hypothetical protein